jgi:hypothetical protein
LNTVHNLLIKSYLEHRSQRVLIKDSYSGTYYSDWNRVKRGVPQGSILGPLFFLFYINDLPETIKDTSLPTLFADDINLICSQRSPEGLKDDYVNVLTKVNKLFQSNSLTLNLNKSNIIHFAAKPTTNIPECNDLGQDRLIKSQTIKFLVLTLDHTLCWRLHITRIGNKLRSACYSFRLLKPTLTPQYLKTIYFAYFHSIMSYVIIFWGNSVDKDDIFKLQQRAIRTMTNCSNRTSCRGLLKELGILPLCSQYILSLALFVARNREDFTINMTFTYTISQLTLTFTYTISQLTLTFTYTISQLTLTFTYTISQLTLTFTYTIHVLIPFYTLLQ